MRGSTAALMAAAAGLLVLMVSPALLMLLASPAAPDTYEKETRRMFKDWKAKVKKTYKYAGEEECRYAIFKNTRGRVARRANAAGVTPSGRINGFGASATEEMFFCGHDRDGIEEQTYEEETRWAFVGWKARYGKTYRDVGEEKCRYMLFKGNRRVVVKLNAAAAAAGETTTYELNQFGDLTNEEVRERCDGRGGVMEGKLSARCQAAVAGESSVYERLIHSQVCRCIASELNKQSPKLVPFLEMKHTRDLNVT